MHEKLENTFIMKKIHYIDSFLNFCHVFHIINKLQLYDFRKNLVINQSELCDWSMICYIYNLIFVLVFIVGTLDTTPHHKIFDLIFLSSTTLQTRKNEVEKRSFSKKTTTNVRHSRICGFLYQKFLVCACSLIWIGN